MVSKVLALNFVEVDEPSPNLGVRVHAVNEKYSCRMKVHVSANLLYFAWGNFPGFGFGLVFW